MEQHKTPSPVGKLAYCLPSGRSEAQARQERREAGLRRAREIGRAEGVPARLLDESEASMRTAFAFSDMLFGALK